MSPTVTTPIPRSNAVSKRLRLKARVVYAEPSDTASTAYTNRQQSYERECDIKFIDDAEYALVADYRTRLADYSVRSQKQRENRSSIWCLPLFLGTAVQSLCAGMKCAAAAADCGTANQTGGRGRGLRGGAS